MKTVVVRNIKRTDAELVKRLGALGVATAHEAYGRFGLMKPYLRPVWSGAETAGTAVTVLAQPGDNWMIHVAVEQCQPGDILVVGCTTDNTDGMFGDLLATSLMARGVKGLVIDAGVRDAKSLREMGFPVWSKAISAKGTVKATLGAVNVPVVCAGINVNPGDAVVADDDGVVVIGRKDAADVVAKGEKRVADEDGKRQTARRRRARPRHVQYARAAGEGRPRLCRRAGGGLRWRCACGPCSATIPAHQRLRMDRSDRIWSSSISRSIRRPTRASSRWSAKGRSTSRRWRSSPI